MLEERTFRALLEDIIPSWLGKVNWPFSETKFWTTVGESSFLLSLFIISDAVVNDFSFLYLDLLLKLLSSKNDKIVGSFCFNDFGFGVYGFDQIKNYLSLPKNGHYKGKYWNFRKEKTIEAQVSLQFICFIIGNAVVQDFSFLHLDILIK